MRIKENITLMDKVNAVESIVSSYFQDGDYTPYYAEMAEIIAVVTYFIEGITLEKDDNIYDLYEKDDELRNLVDHFVVNNIPITKFTPANEIMRWVRNQVCDKVGYIKENIIHSTPDLDTIVDAANVIIGTLSNFSKLNLSTMSSEDIELGRTVMKKISDSGIKITPESITEIIKNAVPFDIDEASTEIIDTLKAENKELRKYKMLWDSRNVTKTENK